MSKFNTMFTAVRR